MKYKVGDLIKDTLRSKPLLGIVLRYVDNSDNFFGPTPILEIQWVDGGYVWMSAEDDIRILSKVRHV